MPDFAGPISDARWHALGPAHMQAPSSQVDVVPAQHNHLRGSDAVAVQPRWLWRPDAKTCSAW
jgi:hypothetical protein